MERAGRDTQAPSSDQNTWHQRFVWKSGAKGACEIHQNDTECWARLMLLRGLNGVCLNVFSPCEGVLQEALWSGTEHAWSSAPAAVLPSSADCPLPQSYRSLQADSCGSSRVAGHPVNLKRAACNRQDETTWFSFLWLKALWPPASGWENWNVPRNQLIT